MHFVIQEMVKSLLVAKTSNFANYAVVLTHHLVRIYYERTVYFDSLPQIWLAIREHLIFLRLALHLFFKAFAKPLLHLSLVDGSSCLALF